MSYIYFCCCDKNTPTKANLGGRAFILGRVTVHFCREVREELDACDPIRSPEQEERECTHTYCSAALLDTYTVQDPDQPESSHTQ